MNCITRYREYRRLLKQAGRLPVSTWGQAIIAKGRGEITLEQYQRVMRRLREECGVVYAY